MGVIFEPSRRTLLAGIGAGLVLLAVRPPLAFAALADGEKAIRDSVGDPKRAQEGRISVDLPPLAESGNSVPLGIRVESPMTEGDYVRTVWVFAPENPRPRVAIVHLTPRAGKAEFDTKIRLAKSQNIVAFAEMSDGSLWHRTVNVMVTVGACESLRFQP